MVGELPKRCADSRRGAGAYRLGTESAPRDTPEGLLELLHQALYDDRRGTPLLPEAAQRALALSQDPKADMVRMRALIETETLLAAKVVQLAQTPFYSAGARNSSLDDALMRLGMRTLTDLFLQVSVTALVFRAKGFHAPMQAIRRHSIACAHLTRKVCRVIGFPEEHAFLCGLLHDAGMAMCLVVLSPQDTDNVRWRYADVSALVDRTHAQASGMLAEAWHLPADIQAQLNELMG